MNSAKPAQNKARTNAEIVLDAKAILGEGAIWHPAEKKLYWVDIEGMKFHVFDPETKKDHHFPVGSRIGTVVPVKGGGAIVALQKGIHTIDTNTGELTLVSQPLTDPDIRFNDGKCDPAGRFWVGTMHLAVKENTAVLYRLNKKGKAEQVLDQLTISNGIVWTADSKTMYLIDTPTGNVQAFDYHQERGEIKNGRVVIRIPSSEGHPDGMTIDEEGKLWIALYGGWGVVCCDPASGELLEKINVPVPNTTSCAFGGEKLDTLYITTARNGLADEELNKFPLSGGIFAAKPGAKGVKANFCTIEV